MFQSCVFFFFFLPSTVDSTSLEQSGWHHESISVWRKSTWKGQSLSPCTAKYPNLCWCSACHCCCQCTRHVPIMFALGDAVVETRVPLQRESSNLCPWLHQWQLWWTHLLLQRAHALVQLRWHLYHLFGRQGLGRRCRGFNHCWCSSVEHCCGSRWVTLTFNQIVQLRL